MRNVWLKVKVGAISLAAVYVLLFLYNNSGQDIDFWWWFGHKQTHSAIIFAIVSFFAGAIVAILVRTTLVTLQQVRELQHRSRIQRLDRELTEKKSKAAMLQTRSTPAVPAPSED